MSHSETPTLRLVAYYRTAVEAGEASPLNLDRQRTAVKAYGWFRRSEVVAQFTEIETSGMETRPQLGLAILEARRLSARLLIADISALLLNTGFVSRLAEAEKNQDVPVFACGFGDGERLPLQFLLSAAKFEARSHSESTKAGLEAARARGAKLGPPNGDNAKTANMARVSIAARNRSKTHAIISRLRRQQKLTTLREIADALTVQGVKTPRGNSTWTPKQVSRIVGPLKKEGGVKANGLAEASKPSPDPERTGNRVLH